MQKVPDEDFKSQKRTPIIYYSLYQKQSSTISQSYIWDARSVRILHSRFFRSFNLIILSIIYREVSLTIMEGSVPKQ